MIEHERRDRHGYFYGPVIDGPFAGDWISSDSPFFTACFISPRINAARISDPMMPNVAADLDRAAYRWIHGYGSWAFMPPYRRPKRA